jgi:hypothetical protein
VLQKLLAQHEMNNLPPDSATSRKAGWPLASTSGSDYVAYGNTWRRRGQTGAPQTNAGWLSFNALNGQALHWLSSEWRRIIGWAVFR